ncbi:UDP-N-acetylmuramoyl-tripeptide--D-alanyl-D-alanine ligase [Breoghania corrubedonensis]|uniref:UDP-N-acetylmuramoyl-tripeptide--D-alanyl-D-alanine ligase n=1 Tax=Breoghania corrubedonensis TaxID=665038 RepID=A0A2T5V4X6_9HYPH|nr:UDP-N-acetylmuramoylalanyl-D-glutamyl-2,6-diaminopimelate--D-alanyl-D-alanine ligase [Breoghania corrubedonensis]PTW58812.1 UDP-N-acetylmuramoyl-tripeptide--D-alanyl-D-alanine ligase [Breoghania corrubedonensis]
MSDVLWRLDDLVEAVSGRIIGDPTTTITGISIDSRSIQPGEAFFAIKGEIRDGHKFVEGALSRGAALAVVAEDRLSELPPEGRYVAVPDVLQALQDLGRAARARTNAKIIAVTGSVGKTSSKEMLRLALAKSGRTHASVASYNNHWGVPLTLARMPANTEYGVFEIGMNHAGEITPLVAMVRPHVAIVTTVAPVHLAQFVSVEDIARAKAEIFTGLEPGGVAVLNASNPQFDLLRFLASVAGVKEIVTFGADRAFDAHVTQVVERSDCSCVSGRVLGEDLTWKIGAPGRHLVDNSLAVLAAVKSAGADLALGALALGEMEAPKGRGERHQLTVRGGTVTLIDESYNANPASMRAAIALLGRAGVERGGRRIAVLGDMLELGERAGELHRELAGPLETARIDLVYCVGRSMRELWEHLPQTRRGEWVETSDELKKDLLAAIRAGDAVMIKGSLGTKMGPLVSALTDAYGAKRTRAAS